MVNWRAANRSSTLRYGACSDLRFSQVSERLFQGLDSADINWLLSDKLASSLYVFHLESVGKGSVSRLSCDDIPWPVIFLLGRVHRKFRFLSNSMPTQFQLLEALSEGSSKLKWNNFFASREDSHVCPPKQLLFRKKVSMFTGKAPPELNDFCARMSQRFRDGAASAISRQYGRSRRHGNVLPIHKAAYEWLKASEYCAVPCDKETGYCLVKLRDFDEMQCSIFAKDWYEAADPRSVSAEYWSRSMVPCYTKISKAVAAVDDRISVSRLLSSLQFGRSRFPSQLMHTCKTHKKDHCVTFRPVHGSSSHPFSALMAWVNLILDSAIAKFRHVLRSADDLLMQIRDLRAVPDMIWLHYDLSDFFMSGKTDFLVHHASLIVPSRFREIFRTALKFILDHQFVTCRRDPAKLYRVVQGTGMGLKCSSSVADAAFLHSIELCSIGLSLRRTQERAGIVFYRRFRDNLLFAWHPEFVKIKQIVSRLEQAFPYTGAIEEASPGGVDFLDMTLYHDVASGRVHYSPLLKPTALASVLSLHSAHPLSVHGAWLKAYLFRIRRRSSSLEWYCSYKHEVLSRLESYGLDPAIIAALDRETRFIHPVKVPAIDLRRQRVPTFRLVLPYHPVWQKEFLKACAEYSQELKGLKLPGLDFDRLSISWQLRSPAMGSIILKF